MQKCGAPLEAAPDVLLYRGTPRADRRLQVFEEKGAFFRCLSMECRVRMSSLPLLRAVPVYFKSLRRLRRGILKLSGDNV